MLVAVVDTRHERILKRDTAAGGPEEMRAIGHECLDRVGLGTGDDGLAQLLVGRMDGHCERGAHVVSGAESADCIGHANCADRDVARGEPKLLVQHSARRENRWPVQQWLAHAHEDNIGDALLVRFLHHHDLHFGIGNGARGESNAHSGSSSKSTCIVTPPTMCHVKEVQLLMMPTRAAYSKPRAATWSTISCGSRLRAKPPFPVAQNVQRIGQPTCNAAAYKQPVAIGRACRSAVTVKPLPATDQTHTHTHIHLHAHL
eukprot:363869-Chlamydomonas_euryale.AAC.26